MSCLPTFLNKPLDSFSSVILETMYQLDLRLLPENKTHFDQILSFSEQNLLNAVSALWSDPSVQEAVRRSHKFHLNDSAVYYFNSTKRMSSPGYLPTDEDILRSSVKTTGITGTIINMGKLTYMVFDTGGQRSERKKWIQWIQCFENVMTLVFVVSLSEYDQMLYEDEEEVFLSRYSPLRHVWY
jgi:guanine nucleotide-binding protein G(i) subunit alpha